LQRGHTLLHLGCGYGRIANGLARRGVTVTGIEATSLLLERARSHGDIRDLRGIGPFDAVLIWFYSLAITAKKTIAKSFGPRRTRCVPADGCC
jgi:protein-L-isoaspartate O-methyltransferase